MGKKQVEEKRAALRAMAQGGSSGLAAYQQGIDANRSQIRNAIDFALDGGGPRTPGGVVEGAMARMVMPYADNAEARLLASQDAYKERTDSFGAGLTGFEQRNSEMQGMAFDVARDMALKAMEFGKKPDGEGGGGGDSLTETDEKNMAQGMGLDYRNTHVTEIEKGSREAQLLAMDQILQTLPAPLKPGGKHFLGDLAEAKTPEEQDRVLRNFADFLNSSGEYMNVEAEDIYDMYAKGPGPLSGGVNPRQADRIEATTATGGPVPQGNAFTQVNAAADGEIEQRQQYISQMLAAAEAAQVGYADAATYIDPLTGKPVDDMLLNQYLASLYDNEFSKQAYVDLGFGDPFMAEGMFNPLYGGDDPVARVEGAEAQAFYETYGMTPEEYEEMTGEPGYLGEQAAGMGVVIDPSAIEAAAKDLSIAPEQLLSSLASTPDAQEEVAAAAEAALADLLEGAYATVEEARRSAVQMLRTELGGTISAADLDALAILLTHQIDAQAAAYGYG